MSHKSAQRAAEEVNRLNQPFAAAGNRSLERIQTLLGLTPQRGTIALGSARGPSPDDNPELNARKDAIREQLNLGSVKTTAGLKLSNAKQEELITMLAQGRSPSEKGIPGAPKSNRFSAFNLLPDSIKSQANSIALTNKEFRQETPTRAASIPFNSRGGRIIDVPFTDVGKGRIIPGVNRGVDNPSLPNLPQLPFQEAPGRIGSPDFLDVNKLFRPGFNKDLNRLQTPGLPDQTLQADVNRPRFDNLSNVNSPEFQGRQGFEELLSQSRAS